MWRWVRPGVSGPVGGAYHQLDVVICPEEQRDRVSFDAAAVDGSVHSRLEHVIYGGPYCAQRSKLARGMVIGVLVHLANWSPMLPRVSFAYGSELDPEDILHHEGSRNRGSVYPLVVLVEHLEGLDPRFLP